MRGLSNPFPWAAIETQSSWEPQREEFTRMLVFAMKIAAERLTCG
jgi:hypothetical protein